jgi:signal peptidase II
MPWVFAIAVVTTALDQTTKWLIERFLPYEHSRVVIPGFFNLVHWRNPGAAWGMFPDANTLLAIISVLTVLALVLFRHSFQLHRPSCRIALGLIGGGVTGNLIDRLRLGSVIDFLHFHIGHYHWPAFNIADSAICTGVALYILATWRSDQNKPG